MKPITEITLAQGNGGQGMQQLIDSLFLQAFSNPYLNEKEDQARIPLAELQAAGDRLAFSTDSYVIDPIIFLAVISASWRYAVLPMICLSAVRSRAIFPADLSLRKVCRLRSSLSWLTAWQKPQKRMVFRL